MIHKKGCQIPLFKSCLTNHNATRLSVLYIIIFIGHCFASITLYFYGPPEDDARLTRDISKPRGGFTQVQVGYSNFEVNFFITKVCSLYFVEYLASPIKILMW